MRTIIAGSRDITDYGWLCDAMDEAERLHGIKPSVVVSGAARGVDRMGERWAKERGIPVDPYVADWKTHGRAAGPIRNREMAENADALVALWDGHSGGTKDMIEVAKKKGLTFYVETREACEGGRRET